MKPSGLEPKYKAAAAGAGAFLLAIWLANVFFFSGISRESGILDRARAAALQKKEARENIALIEARVRAQADRLAESPDAGIVIQALNDMASASGAQVTSVTPQPIVRVGKFLRIPVLVEMRCTYAQLGDFAARIESSPRVLRMDRVYVSPPEPPDPGATMKADLTVSSYYLLQQ